MFGDRYEIRLMLEAATPLHIGNGEFADMPSRPGANEVAFVATIVRDVKGLPYLPATSIKGALRRLAKQHFPGDGGLVPLFGSLGGDEHDETPGIMGRLLTRGGKVTGALPDTSRAPFAHAVGHKACFIAARTAIDHEKGVADDHKLFHQEMVAPGLCFEVVMMLVCFGKSAEQSRALNLLKRLLKVVARDGLMLGRSQADGHGLLKVKGRTTITPYVLNDVGELVLGDAEFLEIEAAPAESKMFGDMRPYSFALLCAAPFAIIDSSVKGAGKDIARELGTVQLAAQRLADNRPLILGSSISGALRARASWLWRREVLRREMTEARTDEDDPVRELFGTTGRRALIEIRNLKVSEAAGEKITSLKVDRFSAAPVHGALFTTDSFTGTRLSFDLVMLERGKAAGKDAKALWQKLLWDIEKHGLEIGHGVNRGFGWFQPEKTA